MQHLKYYLYRYTDPITSSPIYIGKGQGRRAWVHLRHFRSSSFSLRVKDLLEQGVKPIVEILCYEEDESEIFKREKEWIERLGRVDLGTGTLLNQTGGGGGTGCLSEEKRLRKAELMRKQMAGAIFTDAHRMHISEACTGLKRSEEHRAKISEVLRRRVIKNETREKCRAASKLQVMKPEAREKSRIAQLNQPLLSCIHCGGKFKPAALGRYHGNNCKLK